VFFRPETAVFSCNPGWPTRFRSGRVVALTAPDHPDAEAFLPLDPANARRFVETHAPMVAAQVARFGLPADVQEDVVQETLLRALRGLPGFRGDARLSTWVTTIARREAIRRRETLARQDRIGRSGAFGDDRPEPADPDAEAPPEAVARDERRRRVREALARLPDDLRLALGYFYFDRLGVAEIAQVMDSNPNTVKSWLKRGRDRLAAMLGPDGPEGDR